MILFISMNGKKLLIHFIQRIISLNLQDEFALRHARARAGSMRARAAGWVGRQRWSWQGVLALTSVLACQVIPDHLRREPLARRLEDEKSGETT